MKVIQTAYRNWEVIDENGEIERVFLDENKNGELIFHCTCDYYNRKPRECKDIKLVKEFIKRS